MRITKVGYSNAGCSMLVKVIEEISKTSADDYFQTNIFTPARINQNTVDWDSAFQDLAVGYEKVDGEFNRSPADHSSTIRCPCRLQSQADIATIFLD